MRERHTIELSGERADIFINYLKKNNIEFELTTNYDQAYVEIVIYHDDTKAMCELLNDFLGGSMDFGTCDYNNANDYQKNQEIELLKNKVKELTYRNEKLKEELNKQHRMYGSWSMSYKDYASATAQNTIVDLKRQLEEEKNLNDKIRAVADGERASLESRIVKLEQENKSLEYANDIADTAFRAAQKAANEWYDKCRKLEKTAIPVIKNVIFNDPATIVFWEDGTKTVVKAQGDDIFDPEKGLALAYLKKSKGNTGKYYDEVKKWTEPYIQKEYENVMKNAEDFSEMLKLWMGYTADRLNKMFSNDKESEEESAEGTTTEEE